jgi:hypothetical protein
MAAFTVNSVTSKGPWLVVDGYSTDVSTSTALLADVTNHSHVVKSISIDYQKGTDDRWIKIFDGTDLQIGPAKPGTKLYELDFGPDGLTFEEGVYFQTESDAQFHVNMVYKIVPGPGRL